MILTGGMCPHWSESRPFSATRLSGFHPQASGLYYVHINPTSHRAIAKPNSTTSNIKHSASWQGALFRKHSEMHRPVAKCQGQTAKAWSMLHDVKDEVEANKHKGVLHPAVGFVWHVHGPVNDAKINMDSAGYQPEEAALSVQKASLCSYMAEWLETQVPRRQGSKLVRSMGPMRR